MGEGRVMTVFLMMTFEGGRVMTLMTFCHIYVTNIEKYDYI